MAFFRRHEKDWSLAAMPRWLAAEKSKGDVRWQGTTVVLPKDAPDAWSNVLAGARSKAHVRHGKHALDVAELFEDFPVGLLSSGFSLAAV